MVAAVQKLFKSVKILTEL